MVTIKTSMGDIKVELFEEEAPITVSNFLEYVDSDHYKDTIFHRVIDGFMIQGGGFDTNFEEKFTEPPIKNEAANGLKNERVTLAMARTGVVDSATAQFFINVKDNHFLNHKNTTTQGYGYCVFGKVVEGMDVIDKMEKVKTSSHGHHDDVPKEDIVILETVRDED